MIVDVSKPLRFGIACYSDEINICELIYWMLIVVAILYKPILTRCHLVGRNKEQILRDWIFDKFCH